MAKRARSARGEIIDFDLINIKAQLAEAPAAVDVAARRNYIDTKEGIKPKVDAPVEEVVDDEPIPEAVAEAASATEEMPADGDPFDLVNG